MVSDVKEHMIVNGYIKQLVVPDSLTIRNSLYDKRNGFKIHKRATSFCEVCLKWKYRSTYWVMIKDIID